MAYAPPAFVNNRPNFNDVIGNPSTPRDVVNPTGNFVKNVAAGVAEGLYNSASNSIGKALRQRSERRSTKLHQSKPGSSSGDNGKNGGNNNNKGGSGKGNNKKSGSKNDPINKVPGPAVVNIGPVSWNSGISSGLLINPSQMPTDYYTPVYVQNGCLFSDITNTNSDSGNLLNSYIYHSYITQLQSKNNLNIERDFSKTEFLSYFAVITEALQLYYQVDSIIVIAGTSNIFNPGISHLRLMLSAEIVNFHDRLGDYLTKCAIPTNLLNYIRYMYQNFSFGTSIESPIIRLGFKSTLFSYENRYGMSLSASTYGDLIGRLGTFSKISSLIGNARREWINPTMPKSTDQILYDPQFLNFWHNSNISYRDISGTKNSRTVVSKNTNCYYGLFSDFVDGTIYAASSLELNGVINPGIWDSFSNFDPDWMDSFCSSLSYFDGGNITAVDTTSIRYSSHIFSAPYFDNEFALWVPSESSSASCRLAQSSSLFQMQQSVSKTIETLFTIS